MIKREYYIQKLKKWKNKPVIKVITGIRRAGKSTIMKLFIDELLKEKVDKNFILYINKESLEFDFIQNYKQLYKFVKSYISKINKKIFLFIDEIQLIESWEKAIISIFSENLADIYIAGSNSNPLSNELATLLSGRYIKINVYPLTFSEFIIFKKNKNNIENNFNEYLEYGGMPGLHHLIWEKEIIYEYLNSIFDTIVLKDIVKRYNIRQVSFLEKIIKYIFDNISNIFSAKKIVDFMKKEYRKSTIETIYNYLKYLEDAFIINKVPRYDIKGKKILETKEKYFVTDIGLRHAILGYREKDINQLLENILYIELKKRNYKIYIGQIQTNEIDFILEKNGKMAYAQVVYLLSTEETIKREFDNLLKIKDNYPKYVISLDKHFIKDLNGIKHLNLIEFLMDENINLC